MAADGRSRDDLSAGASPAPSSHAPDLDAASRAAAAADEALAGARGPARLPLGKALGAAALWLGAEAGLAYFLTRLTPPWGPVAPAEAAAAALAVTAPVAVTLLWAGLARRGAEAERRLEALARATARAAAARAAAPRPAASEGLTREDLTHAVAHAARDALDGERSAIARRMAELAETQRRLTETLAAIGPAPSPSAPAPTPPAPARPAAPAPVPAPVPLAPARADAEPALPLDPPAPPPARAPAAIPASPAPAAAEDPQGSLPLAADAAAGGGEGEAARDWAQVALALDFPKDERDDAGWAALAAGARDRPIAELLQAAEDALTILAQHGVYMEDLAVRLAPPALWTRFAQGERGPALASVGGVDSPEAVDAVRRMMKADPVFRDTAMHLMRRFDGVLRRAAAEPRGAGRLLELADSRTGRAFMLVAQAVGTFD
ncbi:hypothetical protein P2H44_24770 [Albimonas sp. CAU 1670]|uniref:hypothetical protein n=1 Tax=Albimonas sp. CAU 1670 TaxID=3032599 RepID=UPI0023DB21C1|nr:hypothetical protein [Albimonas sp. CAU 1670]MDF2235779.1 hypothetical protein [Albimonas sp. CAU 1670]